MTQTPLRLGFGGLPVKTTNLPYITGIGRIVIPVCVCSVMVW